MLFGISTASGENIEPVLRVPVFVAAAAGLNSIVAILALVFGKNSKSLPWGAASYGLLAITVGALVFTTGGVMSPYVALWMLMAVLSGLFGIVAILALALIANSFLAWQIIEPATELVSARLVPFALATNLPLVVSYIVWHKKSTPDTIQEDARADLAKQLTEVANKSEIVIESIADGVIAVDAKGNIQLINPAAQNLVGWAGTDAKGLHYEAVVKLVDKRDMPLTAEQNPLEQVKTARKSIVNNELTLVSKADKKMLVSLVVSPVMEGSEVAARIIVFRDITTEKARERDQAEFVSTASHEMRTPVAAIEGYLGLLANPRTASIDEKGRMYLSKAQESVQHLGRLFQDLLTVSRSEDGRLAEHPQITDVVAFLASITESLVPKAEGKNLSLEFIPNAGKTTDSEHKLTPAYFSNVDRDHLREVSANLIENAIKYTKEGKVAVDVNGDDKRVTVSIKDSGIGIGREDIPHLFQKFYRIDNSDTREIGGTGLGLYICHRLVEAMRGRIWVESEPGKGSTFFVSLPRVSNMEIKRIQQSEAIEALQRQSTGAAFSKSPQFVQSSTPKPAIDVLVPASIPIARPAQSHTSSFLNTAPVSQTGPQAPPAPSAVASSVQAPAAPVTPWVPEPPSSDVLAAESAEIASILQKLPVLETPAMPAPVPVPAQPEVLKTPAAISDIILPPSTPSTSALPVKSKPPRVHGKLSSRGVIAIPSRHTGT